MHRALPGLRSHGLSILPEPVVLGEVLVMSARVCNWELLQQLPWVDKMGYESIQAKAAAESLMRVSSMVADEDKTRLQRAMGAQLLPAGLSHVFHVALRWAG